MPVAVSAPAPPPEAQPEAALERVKVRGLAGTLNKDDVHQTMEERQPAFDTCILASRRRLRWVSGEVRFAFTVDAEGAVSEARPLRSDIGHYALETCIATTVRQTRFPKPAGRADAEFEWALRVEPAPGRMPEPLPPEVMERAIEKHSRELREDCELTRRDRYQVTAYVAASGKILSAGATWKRDDDPDKLACVLEAIKRWKLRKQHRTGKVSFALDAR